LALLAPRILRFVDFWKIFAKFFVWITDVIYFADREAVLFKIAAK
jgi:hypothetical protein